MSLYKTFVSLSVVIFTLFFVLGCAQKQPEPINGEEQLFPGEDKYIIQALEHYEKGNLERALKDFTFLYEHAPKAEYKYHQVEILLKLQRYNEAFELAHAFLAENPDDLKMLRQMANVKLHQNDPKGALEYAKKLLELEKTEMHYELVATIYFAVQNYDEGVKYLEGAYSLQSSPRMLEKLVNIFLLRQQWEEAISYLQTHIRQHGCSREFCEKLVQMYRSDKDIEGMIATYQRLYETFKDSDYGNSIVELYIYQDKLAQAVAFLEKNNPNSPLLLELYSAQKDYGKARNLADQLYRQSKNAEFLAKAAIFEYEFADDKNNPKMLHSVWDKLEKVNESLDDANYQNFLGYLLIDHDLDLEEGVRLVKSALEKEPESAYYIDSLAWGYYKLGRCNEAYRLMKKVVDMIGLNEEEVRTHWQLIQDCINKESP